MRIKKKQPVSCFFYALLIILPVSILDRINIQKEAYSIYNTATTAVQPSSVIKKHSFISENRLHIGEYVIEINLINNFILIAAGKAASAMAKEAELQLGNLISGGICITKYNHALELKRLKTIEAAYPVPNENSILGGNNSSGTGG